MRATRCYWFGHAWRLVTRGPIRDGLSWSVFHCRRCPARIELAEGWPDGGGIFHRGDLVSLILVIAAGAGIVLVEWSR